MSNSWEITLPIGIGMLVYGLGESGITWISMAFIVCGMIIVIKSAV